MDAWKLIRFCGLVVELHMHTNVYAVLRYRLSKVAVSSHYTGTLSQSQLTLNTHFSIIFSNTIASFSPNILILLSMLEITY